MKNLQYRDRIDIMLKNFTEKQKQIYKKRIQVENFFANLKQLPKLSARYEKYYEKLVGLIYIYMAQKLL